MDNIHEDIIFFAFRYALGRKTGAVDIVVSCLKENWDKLLADRRDRITEEILNAIEHKMVGMNCDIESWKEILNLTIK